MSTASDALDFLQMVLTKLWTIGLLLLTFSIVVLNSERFGFKLLPIVKEWSGTVGAAGTTFIAVSFVLKFIEWMNAIFSALSASRHQARREVELQDRIIKNLQTLTENEVFGLLDVLNDPNDRYQLPRDWPAFTLVSKGILEVTQTIDGNSYVASRTFICKLNDAVADQSENLKEQLLKIIRRNPYDYQGLAHRYLRPEDFEAENA